MYLSNPHAAAFLIMWLFCTAGCSWFSVGEPSPSSPSAVSPPDSGVPFEVREPETYQADFVTVAGGSESRVRFARKAGRWRFDSFDSDGPVRSIIQADPIAYVDHTRKQFAEPPTSGPDPQPPFIEELTTSLLHPPQHARFEKLDAANGIDRYKVIVGGSETESTISYDPAIKMIIRHEYDGGFAFEMRNFTLEVDDTLFLVPRGYRKIPWAAYKEP